MVYITPFTVAAPAISPFIPVMQDQNWHTGDGGPGSPLSRGRTDHDAGAFDRRIVACLAFGPFATVLAMGIVSGRGAVPLWGYPLFLFFGLWLVLSARRALTQARLARIVAGWAIVFACLSAAFYVNYDVLPRFDHRYRAVFFPGGALGRDITQRYQAATGKKLAYVIGTMWDGGNTAHYSPDQETVYDTWEPRVY